MTTGNEPDLALLRLFHESGEAIGLGDLMLALGVSREELYRRIEALREQGYVIGKSHPYGSAAYHLLDVPDRLFPHEIRWRVKTRWLGTELRVFDLCDSTNEEARRLAAAGAPHGTIVLAEEQRSGRGRGDRTWHSPRAKGLYLSILLRTGPSALSAAALQLGTGVAVAHAIMKFTGLAARLRWPNDVLMDGRKISGILAEAVSGEEETLYVVGIGLNVSHAATDFPGPLREEATSLAIAAKRNVTRMEVLRPLLETLEEWYDSLLRGETERLTAAVKPLSVLLDRDVVVERGEQRIEGRVTDLSPVEGIRIVHPGGDEWIPAEHVRRIRLADEVRG